MFGALISSFPFDLAIGNNHLLRLQALPPWQTRIIGKNATEWVLRRGDCPIFDDYELVEIGHVDAGSYHKAIRADWPFTMVIVCSGGLGAVRSGEQLWQLGPGQALLLPPHRPHDFQSEKSGWNYTVLNYHSESLIRQNIGLPKLISIHAQSLEAMILAFRREYQSERDLVLLRQMLEIIQTKILRLFSTAQRSSRLGALWSKVLEKPAFNWTIKALTRHAHLSGEHLRRICQHDLGRSPMGHVTWLRLKVAANRLTVSDDVIEEIAHEVGFESERAFRSAFTKMFDLSPTQYRQKNRLILDELNQTPSPGSAPRHPFLPPQERDCSSAYLSLNGSPDPDPLPLDAVANAVFSLGDHPWFGDLPLSLPATGNRRIHGVPFLILDEKKGPCFVLMRSRHVQNDARNRPLPDKVRIPFGRTARFVYFLHACGWGSEFGLFATYRFIYADQSVAEQPVIVLAGSHPEETDGCKANIQDWYFSWEQLVRPFAKPHDATPSETPTVDSQYLYTLEWTNPFPDKKIAFLEINSDPEREPTLATLAVSFLQVPSARSPNQKA